MKTEAPTTTKTFRLVLLKGNHHYLFRWQSDQLPDLLRTLGRWAADPELSLTWSDVSAVTQVIEFEAQRLGR